MENEILNNETPENPAQPEKTPLERVKEQQARMQNREVLEERVESQAEVPSGSVPSNRRKHPHRQLG
jgi:hypothetical protein